MECGLGLLLVFSAGVMPSVTGVGAGGQFERTRRTIIVVIILFSSPLQIK